MGSQYLLRWYQSEAIYAIFAYFANGGTGNPIIAMPTGTGKSLVIAEFIRQAFGLYPQVRIMMLTHVKKLIQQNATKLIETWSTAPLGIYSAGLNSRDMILPIVFGGVQSVAPAIKKSLEQNYGMLSASNLHFGWRDLIIIDECHLLGPKETAQYQYVINELKKINPALKVIGLSATPYRMKQGMLTEEGGLFTDIIYNITDIQSFNRLIYEGYMSTLVSRPTVTHIDMSGVSIVAGEWNKKQAANAVDRDDVVDSACREMIHYGQNRKSWVTFAASIENAEHINYVLQSYGVNSTVVHSKLGDKINDQRIEAFQNFDYQCIVNMDMLTTGFDHPPIDLISDMQPTRSTGKHVQKYGRGTRPSPETGKRDCLGLDFARNVANLGPINDPRIPRKPGDSGPGDAPIRICGSCGIYNHASARVCVGCGAEFEFAARLFAESGTAAIIRTDDAQIEYFEVSKVLYTKHAKFDKQGNPATPPSVKVTYICGLRMFSEWVCFEHGGYAAKRAVEWWRQRSIDEPPQFTYQALERTAKLKVPARIRVHVNKTHPEILSCEY